MAELDPFEKQGGGLGSRLTPDDRKWSDAWKEAARNGDVRGKGRGLDWPMVARM